MKAHGRALLVALLLSPLAPGVAAAASGGPAGPQGTGVSYTLSPDRPAELDDIIVHTTVSHDVCYEVYGVEIGISPNAVDIAILANPGDLCPAVVGPFEETLPIPIGQLDTGPYALDVSFSVCDDVGCVEIGIGGDFDVVPIGDASCDMQVNSIDANLVLQSAAQLIQRPPCNTAADTNRDGNTQSTDATLILQYTAGLLGQLPPA